MHAWHANDNRRLRIVAGVMMMLASTFAIGSVAHIGVVLGVGPLRLREPRILAATIVETVCAIALGGGAVGLWTNGRAAWWTAALALAVSLGGVLLGMAALAVGAGPRTMTNDLYHVAVLLVLLPLLLWLVWSQSQREAGEDTKRRYDL